MCSKRRMVVIWASVFLLLGAIFLSFAAVRRTEAFIGSPNARRCGVDIAGWCAPGEQCLNGYCHDATPPAIPKNTGLPVLP